MESFENIMRNIGNILTDGCSPRNNLPTNQKAVLPVDSEPKIVAETVTPIVEPTVEEMAAYLQRDSGFKFGSRSLRERDSGVKPELVAIADKALLHTTQDFMFFDGNRTVQEQRNMVNRGASKTMQSKHRGDRYPDGLSRAMDLVPVVGTIPKWDWELIFPLVAAVDYAATELGFAKNIRWGGAWDRTLADFGGEPDAYRREIRLYADRHPGRDFLDGPHFEWRD